SAIRRDSNDQASVSDDGRIDVANNNFVERGNFAKSSEINSRPITPNNHAAFSSFSNCTYENYRPATTGESIPPCMPQPLITSPWCNYHDAHSDCYYIDNCSNAYRARMACNTYDGHNTYRNTYKDVYGPPVQTQAHVPHYPGYIHGMVSYHTHLGDVLSSSIY
ncbi:7089_t:CDS:1, partial [Paraglomus occultum]